MVDLLLAYSLFGCAWGTWVELLNGKGFVARAGVIFFFPFIAITLLWETIKGK